MKVHTLGCRIRRRNSGLHPPRGRPRRHGSSGLRRRPEKSVTCVARPRVRIPLPGPLASLCLSGLWVGRVPPQPPPSRCRPCRAIGPQHDRRGRVSHASLHNSDVETCRDRQACKVVPEILDAEPLGQTSDIGTRLRPHVIEVLGGEAAAEHSGNDIGLPASAATIVARSDG